jgi:hypothetical protein
VFIVCVPLSDILLRHLGFGQMIADTSCGVRHTQRSNQRATHVQPRYVRGWLIMQERGHKHTIRCSPARFSATHDPGM